MLLRKCKNLIRRGEVVCDDDGWHASDDREFLNIPTISNNQNGGRNIELLKTFLEGFGEHRRDNQRSWANDGILPACNEHSPYRIANMSNRSLHDPTGRKVFNRRKKIFSKFECGEESNAVACIIHDRQATKLVFAKACHRLINRSIAVDADDIPLHDILDTGINIGKENR